MSFTNSIMRSMCQREGGNMKAFLSPDSDLIMFDKLIEVIASVTDAVVGVGLNQSQIILVADFHLYQDFKEEIEKGFKAHDIAKLIVVNLFKKFQETDMVSYTEIKNIVKYC